jgi:acetyl-CoA carboxylase carboxyltransferase component
MDFCRAQRQGIPVKEITDPNRRLCTLERLVSDDPNYTVRCRGCDSAFGRSRGYVEIMLVHQNIVTAFARMGGETLDMVANNR